MLNDGKLGSTDIDLGHLRSMQVNAGHWGLIKRQMKSIWVRRDTQGQSGTIAGNQGNSEWGQGCQGV